MGKQKVTTAQLLTLSNAFNKAAWDIATATGSLVNPALAVGPALGSGKAETSYNAQVQQFRDALSGVLDCMDAFSHVLDDAAGKYDQADYYAAGH